MRFVAIALLGLIVAPITASSEDLLKCVDPDVLTGLLSYGYQPGSTVTDEMPTAFSSVRYPDAFDFIGSLTSESHVTAAFRTDLDPGPAESSMARQFGGPGPKPLSAT